MTTARRLSIAAALLVPAPASAFQEDDAASRAAVRNLTAEERAALRDRHEAFLALPDAERARLRSLRETLRADAVAGGSLNATLDRLRDVLSELPAEDVARIDAQSTPAAQAAELRRVLEARRRIPSPEDGPRELFGPGFDAERRAVVVEELIPIVEARAPSLNLAEIAEPRERLAEVLSFLERRYTLRPDGVAKWLGPAEMRDLDARLAARDLPGFGTWLDAAWSEEIARRWLAKLLGDELFRRWAEHVAGPDRDRLFQLLATLPPEQAYDISASLNDRRRGSADWQLGTLFMRATEEELPPGVDPLPDRAAAARAFRLAFGLMDLDRPDDDRGPGGGRRSRRGGPPDGPGGGGPPRRGGRGGPR